MLLVIEKLQYLLLANRKYIVVQLLLKYILSLLEILLVLQGLFSIKVAVCRNIPATSNEISIPVHTDIMKPVVSSLV